MYDIVLGRLPKDKEKFGTDGAILLGKQYVKMGQVTSLSNKIYMDIAGAHVVFICGKRGGGKCLTGDTLVSLGDGSEVPISELSGKQSDVLSLNVSNKIEAIRFEEFFSREVEKLLKITLKSGKQLKLTPEHPLLLSEGWRPVEELQKGEKIASVNETKNQMIWDEIVSIEKLNGKFTVYDISVPDTHNFIANGVIVHNSYTMGVIAEGLADLPDDVQKNLSIIMLDTMGIYWTMKYANQEGEEMLRDWGLKPHPLNIVIYTPKGYFNQYKKEGIPTDYPFSIKPSELTPEDWLLTFEISGNDPMGVLIERSILRLKKYTDDFDIDDIIKVIRADKRSEPKVRDAVVNRFLGTKEWGVFDREGTSIDDLAAPGKVTVLDVSCYATMPGGWKIKSLVIGIVSQRLFIDRMVARKKEEYDSIHSSIHYFTEAEKKGDDMPLVWLVIDEAHEFLPRTGKTTSTDALVTIMREGRQPGISLILATQQPGKIHTDVMTQSDILISHRITAKLDTDALGMLMQSYMREGLDVALNNLPRLKGSALIVDDANERLFPMRVRPRFTHHGGASPSALKKKGKAMFFDNVENI